VKVIYESPLGSAVVRLVSVSGNRYPCGTPYAYFGVRIIASGKDYVVGESEFYEDISDAVCVFNHISKGDDLCINDLILPHGE
jgi:hypothetical protein